MCVILTRYSPVSGLALETLEIEGKANRTVGGW